jgi:uncharacterized phosphosugar-binding protein
MNAAAKYFDMLLNLLQQLRADEANSIEQAARLCADSIAQQGLVFLFGAGHSRMMCEEMTPRQGCYPGFVSMVETSLSNHSAIIGSNGLRAPLHLEKYAGYAEQILQGFHFGTHDAMIIVSNSGIRPVVVEMASGARRRGLPVIAIVSRQHCESAAAGTEAGDKLIDHADVVIDNHCPPGDCLLETQGLEWRTGPASTVAGATIINMLRCRCAELLLEHGIKPELLPSHQFVGDTLAADQLERFYEAYRRSLRHLYE